MGWGVVGGMAYGVGEGGNGSWGFVEGNGSWGGAVSYTHLTLPTRR